MSFLALTMARYMIGTCNLRKIDRYVPNVQSNVQHVVHKLALIASSDTMCNILIMYDRYYAYLVINEIIDSVKFIYGYYTCYNN